MKIRRSTRPITDPDLCAFVWTNETRELQWFESYLEEKYKGGSENLVSNPPRLEAQPGQRILLPHAYYRGFTKSGGTISGPMECFDRHKPEHLALLQNQQLQKRIVRPDPA